MGRSCRPTTCASDWIITSTWSGRAQRRAGRGSSVHSSPPSSTASTHFQGTGRGRSPRPSIVDLRSSTFCSGRTILSTSGDYLFPVSANVGMNKVNREVEQDLAYDISQDFDGRLVGHAILRIGNRRASDDPGPYATADYRDFFRLYVP